MSDEPLVILKGQVCELREAGGQVVIVQRDAVRDTPAPSDPHEDSDTDYATPAPAADDGRIGWP
jgi:hypothetical protein